MTYCEYYTSRVPGKTINCARFNATHFGPLVSRVVYPSFLSSLSLPLSLSIYISLTLFSLARSLSLFVSPSTQWLRKFHRWKRKVIALDGFSNFVPRSANRAGHFWMKEEVDSSAARGPPDASSPRSAGTAADSIITIKFNWHGTPPRIGTTNLNRPIFPGAGSLSLKHFCFVREFLEPGGCTRRLICHQTAEKRSTVMDVQRRDFAIEFINKNETRYAVKKKTRLRNSEIFVETLRCSIYGECEINARFVSLT